MITSKYLRIIGSLVLLLVMVKCDFELPEEGDYIDQTLPEASFATRQGVSYREIVFTNTSNNQATSYLWDFGDGTQAFATDTTYLYDADGSYVVKLTATDNNGQSSTFEATLEVFDDTPPEASFSFAQDENDFLQFTFSSSSQNASTYSWNFGDGTSSTEQNPVHRFAEEGSYTVTLSIENAFGEQDELSQSVKAYEDLPTISNPSFDNSSVANDNREVWRSRDLEQSADDLFGDGSWVLQISSSGGVDGTFAGKLPTYQSESSGDPESDNALSRRRWMYKAITVIPNEEFTITWMMRNKDANAGTTITARIYDAPFSDASLIDAPGDRLLATEQYDASTGHDTDVYTKASITFNAGDSSEIVLFITNDYTLDGTEDQESETFLDDFSIL